MSIASESEYDTEDEELREAFAKGLLKPGLNVVEEKKKFKNNVRGLNSKIDELRQTLPWIEKLVLINNPAPLAPELAFQIHDQQAKRERQLKGNKQLPQIKPSDDPVINDFKRETMFHRQAQSAVVEGIARLKELNIPTKRPEDYYAEMAKTDEHMEKVKANLVKKQAVAKHSEKIRELRKQRKISKQLQVEATLKKHADKRKLMEEVKKYRKGIRNDLDFLDDKKKPGFHKKNEKSTGKKSFDKRKVRDAKFGFGGKKRGMKKNTRDSAADVSEYRRPGKPGKSNQFKNNSGKFGNSKGKGKAKTNSRPGKSRRVQMKAKRK